MSKTHFIGVAIMFAVLMTFMAGCGADSFTVAQQFQEAVNSQDVDSALELITDNASLNMDDPSSVTGKDQIAKWLTTQAELNFQFNGEPISSESGVTFENCSINSYQWSYYGIKALSGTCEVKVEDGLITEFTIQFDEKSKVSLSDSSVVLSNELIGIWTGEWPLPGADPHSGEITLNHLQFSDDGSARLAITPDDLSIAPDSDHPGAHFVWTYENYVLTLQNEGPASEGYCSTKDVGIYLLRNVKNTSGNRMQFKLVSDSCAYRAAMLPRISAPWDPYVP
jgi:hypothetical protein